MNGSGSGTNTDVVVVGAGPAGLASAACLRQAGIQARVIERRNTVASAWRGHYERLHLHTSRRFSGLPHYPMPRGYPKYPSRDQVVAYLTDYAARMDVEPELGVEVQGLDREDGQWRVHHAGGSITARAVVLATGANGVPRLPRWPGLDSFPGQVLHSSAYRSGRDFAGQRVLTVGFGNSGGEIALDLSEHGALPTISVRSAVNVVPRDVMGIPVLAIAIPLSKLPPRVADTLVWPILKAYYPSYRRLGLRKARRGPLRQIAEDDRIPLLDVGTTAAIRRGAISVVGEVAGVEGDEVAFVDGSRRSFDAIVMATGYEPAAPAIRGGAYRGSPVAGEGLYFCGFYVSPRGMLREIGREARMIASDIMQTFGRRANR